MRNARNLFHVFACISITEVEPQTLPGPVVQSVWFAQAPCNHAVEFARASLEDGLSDPFPALLELANVRDDDAEEGCHKVFHKYKLTVDIPIVRLRIREAKLQKLPVLRFSSWMQYLLDHKKLERLTGVPDEDMSPRLTEFWDRYKALYPDHQVFELASSSYIDLARGIPVFAHVDEGRTYKSKALLVLSVHGCLGRGTRSYARRVVKKPHLKRDPMGMNYTGTTWSTNFMYASLLRTSMIEAPSALPALLSDFAEDMTALATTGVQNSAQTSKVWVQILGLKGDLPALNKVGNFVRNFQRVPKQATSRKLCVGVCYLCQAGVETANSVVAFEDFRANAAWKSTMYTARPWEDEPEVLGGGSLPVRPDAPESFFVTDLWHNWHNGLAKFWVANSLVMFVYSPGMVPRRSIEAKLSWLSEDFVDYCRRTRITPYLKEFTRDNLSFDSHASYPQGLWHKGAVSTQFMLYLQDYCERHIAVDVDDQILAAIDS